ncbi:hypothetical protein SAMN05444365_106106 [Micromonospora pattaloongensis]|uniref:Uncharacterized protein n=1 Tax=Micromonospora pattaloongensis TaxID=405436 RepID=A0A1H3QTV9_9ACTN|nr:hypothetical protein [Micromonospora pattaloongensis]SDZ16455.1 hypothetical protein SAMN05444365_106106 [Micromonospora pattaloongensis]
MGSKKRDRVPSTAEGGMNVTPGRQDEHKVYERDRGGRATAGAGQPGTGPGGPLVSGISDASKGSAAGETARTDDEQ